MKGLKEDVEIGGAKVSTDANPICYGSELVGNIV